jgi:Protein of unknown function (DUF2384)
MAPHLPSGRGFVAMLEAFRATGGTVPSEVLDRLLTQHPVGRSVSLNQLTARGEVFGFRWRGSLWIPMFQFNPEALSLKASAQHVRAALPPQASGWALASWFAAPNEALSGRRPVDMLEPGQPLDAVLHAAQVTGLVLDPTHALVAATRPRPQAAALHG